MLEVPLQSGRKLLGRVGIPRNPSAAFSRLPSRGLVHRQTPRPWGVPDPCGSAWRNGTYAKSWGARGVPAVPRPPPRADLGWVRSCSCPPGTPRISWPWCFPQPVRHRIPQFRLVGRGQTALRSLPMKGTPQARASTGLGTRCSYMRYSHTRLLLGIFVNKTNPCFLKADDFNVYNIYL